MFDYFFSFLVARLLRRLYKHVGEIKQAAMSYFQREIVLGLLGATCTHHGSTYFQVPFFFFLCRNVRLLLYLYRMQLACLLRYLYLSMECDVRGGYSLSQSLSPMQAVFFDSGCLAIFYPSLSLSLSLSIHREMRRVPSAGCKNSH